MSRSSGRGLLDETPSRVFRRRHGHMGFLGDRRPARRWRRGGGPCRWFRSNPRPRRLPRLAAHWADRPPLRRLAAPCSGLGCLDGDDDRAADSERGRHGGSCRRDWVGDSNPLTPIIDFSHLLNSYQLRTLLHSFPRSLAANAKKAPARGGLCAVETMASPPTDRRCAAS